MKFRRLRLREAEFAPSVEDWGTITFGETASNADGARLAAESAIAGVLQSEHVLVLCGLGTSLAVVDPSDPAKPAFPTMDDLWTAVEAKAGSSLFNSVRDHVRHSSRNIEDLLSRCQMAQALYGPMPTNAPAEERKRSEEIDTFIATAELAIRAAMEQRLSKPQLSTHSTFLRKLASRSTRVPRADLFTTNYDLCFETAASHIGLPLIDGFSFSTPSRFRAETFDYDIVTSSSYSKERDFVPRLLRLYKLHGSINWNLKDGVVEKRIVPDNPALIYPQAQKYALSYSPPFLELMARYQTALRSRNLGVLVVGCGLNDRHIAEPLLAAVDANPSLRLAICAPDLCHDDAGRLRGGGPAKPVLVSNPYLSHIDSLIAEGDARLTLISGTLPGLVRLMPDELAATDEEAHSARVMTVTQPEEHQ